MHEREPRAGDELERQLARYARVRLDPSQAQTRRARAVLLEAAWRQRIEGTAATTSSRRARRGPFAAWSARRVGASLAAAVLAGLLVGSSAFATSRAGGPLYTARLTLETLTLPSDPAARLDAEVTQAQSRLAEIVDASARGDQGALSAALAAYESSVDELAGTTGAPADRALEAVQFHHTVLLGLSGTVPSQALKGIQNALERSDQAITKLDATVAGGRTNAGTPGAGNGGTPGAGNGGNPGAGNGGNPGAGNGGNGGNPGAGNGGNGGNPGAGNGGNPGAGNDNWPATSPAVSHGPGPAKTPKLKPTEPSASPSASPASGGKPAQP